jgi:hypothetical protein
MPAVNTGVPVEVKVVIIVGEEIFGGVRRRG